MILSASLAIILAIGMCQASTHSLSFTFKTQFHDISWAPQQLSLENLIAYGQCPSFFGVPWVPAIAIGPSVKLHNRLPPGQLFVVQDGP